MQRKIINRTYYLSTKELRAGLYGKWNIYRNIGKEKLSEAAQLKLEWIIFYHTLGHSNASLTANQFGISRKTLHKWLNRFEERNLLSLEEQTRSPKKTRGWEVNKKEEQRIIFLRKTHLKLGKRKLKVLYEQEHEETISTWKIERVIRKYGLYPNKIEYQRYLKRRQENKATLKINKVNKTLKEIKQFGFLWHTDTVIIWWNNKRVCILTAIEEHTRIAYARIYPNNTSTTTEDFLKRLLYVTENKVNIIHSDNGSEFKGNFEKICKTLGILQIYSRARTPTDNAMLERFNRTIQEEWLSQYEYGLDAIQEANSALTEWLIFYNNKRPHQALDYLSPFQYAQKKFFNLLPMYPANTFS